MVRRGIEITRSSELHHLERLSDLDRPALVAFLESLTKNLGALRLAVNQENPAFLTCNPVKPSEQLIVIRMP
jgi:hypothetical protein